MRAPPAGEAGRSPARRAPRSYEDVPRNDAELLGRYRRGFVARGVFEMPESLGRSHISAAHSDDDVERSLEVAREALRAALG